MVTTISDICHKIFDKCQVWSQSQNSLNTLFLKPPTPPPDALQLKPVFICIYYHY